MGHEKLSDEIAAFEGIWKGGYFEGDPLEPLGRSTYGRYGYMSILHATYLRCIKPYLRPDTAAIEIGPGRGAWTKTMLGAKEVWALDALSAEYNRFFEHIGEAENVTYIQVKNFECVELPNDRFDLMFSFGCLCHVSFEGISAYARNIFPKLKTGANCFWLIGDKKKYRSFVEAEREFDVWQGLAPKRRKMKPLAAVMKAASWLSRPPFLDHDDFAPGKGQWHDAGVERTCEMLESVGYRLVDPDVGTIPRDPIIHFTKP